MLKIVFLGLPGSGKGTQSLALSRDLSVHRIVTGDIFRSFLEKLQADNEAIVNSIQDDLLKGDLVSDEFTFNLVKQHMVDKESWILDGFPRNLIQAEMLSNFSLPTHVIFIDVPVELVFKRISGRRIAKGSGRVYNIYFDLPVEEGVCNVSKEILIHREDDYPEIVDNRLQVYEKETQPLLGYYRDKNLLYTIKGDMSVDEVYRNIKEVLSI